MANLQSIAQGAGFGRYKSNIHTMDWRQSIMHQLQLRKCHEQTPFEDIYSYASSMFDRIESYKSENIQLNLQKEHLQQQILGIQQTILAGGSGAAKTILSKLSSAGLHDDGSDSSAASASTKNLSIQHTSLLAEKSQLEKKIIDLQEKLADLLKSKSDTVQKFADLKTEIDEKDRHSRLLMVSLDERDKEVAKLKENLIELDNSKRTLADEYSALNIAYKSLEKKHSTLQKQYESLSKQILALKEMDAERLNAENDKIITTQNERMRKEIAAKVSDITQAQMAKQASDPAALALAAMAADNFDTLDDDENLLGTNLPSRIPGTLEFSFDAHDGEACSVNWYCCNGLRDDFLATGGSDRKVKIWKVADSSHSNVSTLLGSNASITSIDVETESILASSNDYATRIWSISDFKSRRTLTGHSAKVLSAKFLGVSYKVASGSQDRTIKLWDVNVGACTRTYFAGSCCYDLVYNNYQIITGHFDCKIRCWDMRQPNHNESTGQSILQSKITSLDISKDGTKLLCSLRDNTMKCLDLRRMEVLQTYSDERFKIAADCCRAKFSPDGQLIACGSNDGSIYIWDANTAKVDKVLTTQNGPITACCWSPDGKRMVSIERGKRASIWRETLNLLDSHPTENLENDDRAVQNSSKSAEEVTNNNHPTGSDLKRPRLDTSRNDSRGHNHQSKKNSNHQLDQSQRQASSNTLDKKLSFFHGDEDSDGSSSSPSNLQRPVSLKWTRDGEKVDADNNNGFQKGAEGSASAFKKSAEVVESEHDDASSTSSCSCEDHSSVAERSADEFHEDLDYDEDSVTSSPPKTSQDIKQTTESVAKPMTPPSNNGEGEAPTTPNDSGDDSGSLDSDDSESESNAPRSADNGRRMWNGLDNPQPPSHPRIRSVINFNHDNDLEDQTSPVPSGAGDAKVISDKSHKSYDHLLKYFFKDTCYFQIKSINHENVDISKSLGVWSTQIQNEIRLNAAFREHRNVILIFSVQQSGGFQGFARMISEAKPSSRQIPWILPERMSTKSLGGVFKVEWICTKELPFHETHDLYNSFNGNKPVKVARDGQQVEPKVGKKLCRLFPHDSKRNLLSCIATMKRQVSQRKKSSQRNDNFYPLPDRRIYTDERYRQNYVPVQGVNELGDPGLASHHINQNYMNYHDPNSQNYRNIGNRRRPVMGQPNTPGIHNRPNMYPNHYGPIRSHHMPRSVNGMPRCLMPNSYNDFDHQHPNNHQGFNTPMNHNQHPYPPGPYDGWDGPDMGRYHPYQGSRR